tara:strand:+ start:1373 stop:2755 length:1383 start_codon:yes stop_codon:yes gene_type:complete
MATYTVTVSDLGSAIAFGFSQVSGNGETSSSPIQLVEGDVLEFSPALLPGDATITIGSFASTFWTSTSSITFTAPTTTSQSRTVKSSPTLAASSVTASASSHTSDTCFFEIISSTDGLPDDIDGDLGSNITGATPGNTFDFPPVTVSGVSVAIVSRATATSSSGDTITCEHKVGANGTYSASDKICNNGDKIYVRCNADDDFSETVTITMKLGSNVGSQGVLGTTYVQDVVTITTFLDPLTGTRIPFTPSSGQISLNDISKFHGPGDGLQASLSNYYRGGSYIINTTTGSPNNSALPTSGQISFDDFYNSFTTIYFPSPPGNQSLSLNTTSSSATGQLDWSRSAGDWTIGFSPTMFGNVDYRLTHEVTETTGQSGMYSRITQYDLTFGGTTYDLTNTSNHAAFTTGYTTSTNPSIVIDVAANASTEYYLAGEITLTIRHKVQTSYTYSATFEYYILIFGP